MNNINPESALAAAIADRATARAKLEAAVAALSRARETATECQQEADRLAAEEARWVERLGKKISAWIADGSRGSRPTAVSDARAVQQQQSARANAAAAADALSHFEASERAAHEELAAAEQAAIDTVDAFLADEAVKAAEGILQQRDEMVACARRRLPNPLSIPLNKLRELPLTVQRAIALVEKLLPDELDRPLHELGGPAAGMFRAFDNSYEQRRAALIRGDLVAGEAAEVQEAAA